MKVPWAGAAVRRCGRMGFSQVDLVGSGAVALALGVLAWAWMTRAQTQGRLGRCGANLGSVAGSIHRFAADHEGRLPGPDPAQPGDFWWWYKEQVKGYLGPVDVGAAFACPMDRGYSDPVPFHRTPRFDYGSYVFNGVTLPGMPQIGGWPMASVKRPARTLLVMEWAAHAPLSWHRSRTGRRNHPFYKDAECVVAFVDGHVALTPIDYDGYVPAYARDPDSGYAYQFSGH